MGSKGERSDLFSSSRMIITEGDSQPLKLWIVDIFRYGLSAVKRVEKVEDVLAVGDEIKVKVYEIDNQDRINLTMKDLEENKENKEEHVEE